MKKILIILSSVFLIAINASAQYPRVDIPNSEIRNITSSIVKGQPYQLQIMLPAGYNRHNDKKYPVVYLMDSQWDFPLVEALYGQQYYDGFIPAMIIVGITWGGVNPNPDSLRVRDYTPTPVKGSPQSGGAGKFLSFIKKEVFPFVEKNYRVDSSDRTLMGCSLGGLFTMYALFTHPEMFSRYVAASPAWMWDNAVLYQYEKKYDENKPNPPAKLFMCVGGVETTVSGFEKLTRFLENRHYSNLQIESRVLENTGHSGTKGEGFARGLQFVFKRPSLQLSSGILHQYNGTYQLNDGRKIALKQEGGKLTYTEGHTKYALLAVSQTDFYLTVFFFKVHFVKDEKGKVSGFQLDRYESSEFVKKIQSHQSIE